MYIYIFTNFVADKYLNNWIRLVQHDCLLAFGNVYLWYGLIYGQLLTLERPNTKSWVTTVLNMGMISAWTCSNKFYSKYISGNEVVSYESPKPTAGIHRFVFILFRQSIRQTIYAPGWRQNFNTRDFSALYNLGPPVASVFFNCQRENGCGGRRYIRWYWNNLLYRRTDEILHEAKRTEWVVNAWP